MEPGVDQRSVYRKGRKFNYDHPLNNVDIDTWYWNQEKLGHYSVKSDYGLLMGENDRDRLDIANDIWRRMWRLTLPAKIKIFLWRALSNTLPTKD